MVCFCFLCSSRLLKLGKLAEYFSPFYRFRCHYPLITYLTPVQASNTGEVNSLNTVSGVYHRLSRNKNLNKLIHILPISKIFFWNHHSSVKTIRVYLWTKVKCSYGAPVSKPSHHKYFIFLLFFWLVNVKLFWRHILHFTLGLSLYIPQDFPILFPLSN